MFICRLIFRPKYALAAIKKKLYNANPHIAIFGLQVRQQEKFLNATECPINRVPEHSS
jgi:hypothetical protein